MREHSHEFLENENENHDPNPPSVVIASLKIKDTLITKIVLNDIIPPSKLLVTFTSIWTLEAGLLSWSS